MDASVWVAKTGLTAQQRRMTVIANNLANVNTVAFKRDRAVFEDLLYQNIRQPGASADAQTIAPTGLMMGTGSRIIATEKLHEQGNMMSKKDYGSLSVLFQLFTETKIQFDVSKNCFYPQPKVTSTVVTIQRESLFDEEIRLKAFEISKIAFQQKRKKIRSSLSSILTENQLIELNLDTNLRASDLSPEDYLLIAKESN